MRGLAVLAAAALAASAGAAHAAPVLEIRNAVAEVVVVPEARADIEVRVLKSDPRLPLRIGAFMGRTVVDGGLWGRIGECARGGREVEVRGLGPVDVEAAPKIVVRTPLQVRVVAGGAVFGKIGFARSVSLANAGCGDWLIADVRGPLSVSQAGSGVTRAGRAAAAELATAGSGSIVAGPVAGPVQASDIGGGDIDVASVEGALAAHVAGSGRVRIAGGHAAAMQAAVAGSGDVSMSGVAGALAASVVGSGSVEVARVTGPVSRSVVGSGMVRTGS